MINKKTLLLLIQYLIGLPLVLFLIWLLFVIVILTDPGNLYNL